MNCSFLLVTSEKINYTLGKNIFKGIKKRCNLYIDKRSWQFQIGMIEAWCISVLFSVMVISSYFWLSCFLLDQKCLSTHMPTPESHPYLCLCFHRIFFFSNLFLFFPKLVSFFFSLCLKACGILVPRTGIEPEPPALEELSLKTPGLRGKSLHWILYIPLSYNLPCYILIVSFYMSWEIDFATIILVLLCCEWCLLIKYFAE